MSHCRDIFQLAPQILTISANTHRTTRLRRVTNTLVRIVDVSRGDRTEGVLPTVIYTSSPERHHMRLSGTFANSIPKYFTTSSINLDGIRLPRKSVLYAYRPLYRMWGTLIWPTYCESLVGVAPCMVLDLTGSEVCTGRTMVVICPPVAQVNHTSVMYAGRTKYNLNCRDITNC
jgi:hypothetical protein